MKFSLFDIPLNFLLVSIGDKLIGDSFYGRTMMDKVLYIMVSYCMYRGKN